MAQFSFCRFCTRCIFLTFLSAEDLAAPCQDIGGWRCLTTRLAGRGSICWFELVFLSAFPQQDIALIRVQLEPDNADRDAGCIGAQWCKRLRGRRYSKRRSASHEDGKAEQLQQRRSHVSVVGKDQVSI